MEKFGSFEHAVTCAVGEYERFNWTDMEVPVTPSMIGMFEYHNQYAIHVIDGDGRVPLRISSYERRPVIYLRMKNGEYGWHEDWIPCYEENINNFVDNRKIPHEVAEEIKRKRLTGLLDLEDSLL